MKEVTEIKTMNYDKYEEHCESAKALGMNVVELGKYDDLSLVEEKFVMLYENPNKFGLPKECDVELIKIAEESHIDGADKKWVVGDVVVLFDPTNGSKVGTETNGEHEVNKDSSHSEQRNMDTLKPDIEDDSSPNKKGCGKHPNIQKNLKPFPKGVSGNPSGKPKEIFSNVKGSLSWHPSGSIFHGHGITQNNVLFSYSANWESAGSWSLELMTRNRKLILCLLEKLKIQKKASVNIKYDEIIDHSLDKRFKQVYIIRHQVLSILTLKTY
jgi:hypothetical protein